MVAYAKALRQEAHGRLGSKKSHVTKAEQKKKVRSHRRCQVSFNSLEGVKQRADVVSVLNRSLQ